MFRRRNRTMFRRRDRPYVSLPSGSGKHAPHIKLTHVNGDIHIELKKKIQSGEERTLLLKPEQFFEISHKSDEIQQAGRQMAAYKVSYRIAHRFHVFLNLVAYAVLGVSKDFVFLMVF